MQKQSVKTIFQNSLRSLVQANTTFRKPEEILSTPFGFTSYSLLLSSLRISGAYFPNFQTGRKYISFVINIICLSVLSLFTLRYGLRVGNRLGETDSWAAFLDLLFAVNALWSTSLLVNKQQLLHRCLQQSLVYTNFGAEQISLEKLSKNLTFISLSYIVFRIIIDSINLLSKDTLNGYIRMNYNNIIPEKSEFSVLVFILLSIDIAIQRMIILCPTQLIMSLFIVLAKAMKAKFETFNQFFSDCTKNGNQWTAKVLRNWRINRCDLHEMLLELDQLFSPALLVWFAFYVLCIAIETMRLFTGDPSKFVLGHYSLWLIQIIYLSFWFALISYSCISMANIANGALIIFSTTLGCQESTECELYLQLEAMFKQLTKPQLSMTGWKYFNIDKSAVLTTVSAIFTYLVLILEFNPKVKANIQAKY